MPKCDYCGSNIHFCPFCGRELKDHKVDEHGNLPIIKSFYKEDYNEEPKQKFKMTPMIKGVG